METNSETNSGAAVSSSDIVSRHIEVNCPFEVYDSEWEEMTVLINNLLWQHRNGYYSNCRARIVTMKREG